jgi:hypothetical protein
MLNLLVFLIILLEPVQNPMQLSSQMPDLNKPLQDSINVRCLGKYPFADGRTIVTDESSVFVSSGTGILIFNRVNPQAPIARITAPSFISGPCRQGQYFYFLSGEWTDIPYFTNLYIYDVSQPASPSFVCVYRLDGVGWDLFIRGQYAYVTTIVLGNLGGLRILNISNPQAPFQVSYLPLPSAGPIDILGNYAYLASGGFYIIDISNLQAPFQVYNWIAPDSIDIDGDRNIKCIGNILYLGGGVIGEEEDRGVLLTFNVSNPSNPQQIGYQEFWDVASYCDDIEIVGNLAYLTYGLILCVNISNPASVFEIGRYDPFPDWARQIGLHNDTVYAACSESFKKIVFTIPQNPMPIFSYPLPGSIEDVWVKDNYSYLFTSNGVVILDISNPSMPEECLIFRDSVWTKYTTTGYIVDTLLYLAGWWSLNIINISNPEAPYLIGRCSIGWFSRDIKVRGNYAYIAHVSQGFRIYDISNPQAPFLVGQCATPGHWCYGVDLVGNRAYVADGAYFLIIDISNPQAPYILSSYPTNNYTEKVWARGDTAYVVLYQGLLILNCANPYSPSLITRYQISGFTGRDIYLVGNRAYLAGGYGGCRVLDISNPLSPSIIGYYNTPGSNNGIFVYDGLIHTANDQGGYLILEYYGAGVEQTGSEKLERKFGLKILPKPAKKSFLIEYSITKPSIATLDILDSLGRIKKILKKERTKPGNYELNLDVSDLPAGVYFIRLKQDSEQGIERFVIVK